MPTLAHEDGRAGGGLAPAAIGKRNGRPSFHQDGRLSHLLWSKPWTTNLRKGEGKAKALNPTNQLYPIRPFVATARAE